MTRTLSPNTPRSLRPFAVCSPPTHLRGSPNHYHACPTCCRRHAVRCRASISVMTPKCPVDETPVMHLDSGRSRRVGARCTSHVQPSYYLSTNAPCRLLLAQPLTSGLVQGIGSGTTQTQRIGSATTRTRRTGSVTTRTRRTGSGTTQTRRTGSASLPIMGTGNASLALLPTGNASLALLLTGNASPPV